MRDLSSAMQTELAAQKLTPVMFFEGEWTAGFLRFWTGIGTITWGGKTWTGAGNVLGISPIEETTQLRAAGVRVSLSGMSQDIIATVLQYAAYGRSGSIWLGCLAGDSGTLVSDPYLMFQGNLDVPSIEETGDTCQISVSYESRLIDLERASDRRWTQDDQQIAYPGDKGFEFMAKMVDKTVTWGGKATIPANYMKYFMANDLTIRP
jgi:hypothetical protein